MTERGIHRRTVLRGGGAGVVGSLAGCLTTKEKSIEPSPFVPPAAEWPMVGSDAANTGFSPNATVPKTKPELEWKIRFEQDDEPHFGGGGIAALVPADGTVQWRWLLDDNAGASRVAVVGDRLLVGTNKGKLLSLVEPS